MRIYTRLSALFVSPSSLPHYQRNSCICLFYETLCTHIHSHTLILIYVCHYYAANLV